MAKPSGRWLAEFAAVRSVTSIFRCPLELVEQKCGGLLFSCPRRCAGALGKDFLGLSGPPA